MSQTYRWCTVVLLLAWLPACVVRHNRISARSLHSRLAELTRRPSIQVQGVTLTRESRVTLESGEQTTLSELVAGCPADANADPGPTCRLRQEDLIILSSRVRMRQAARRGLGIAGGIVIGGALIATVEAAASLSEQSGRRPPDRSDE